MSIKSLFENIADAIRETSGSSDAYTPAEMPQAIRNFRSIFQTKNLTTTIEGQTTVEGCLSTLSEKTDLTYNTVSGNPVSFTTDSSGISRNTIVTLEPIQSGSGDPSPTNVRPISGYTEIEVNGSGLRITSPLPSTIYGGTYDVEAGKLTVNYALVDLGTLAWTYNSTRQIMEAIVSDGKVTSSGADAVCTKYPLFIGSYGDFIKSDKCFKFGLSGYSVNCTVLVRDTSYSDVATFKTAMSGVQLAYELATPYTIQLEPHLLPLLSGANTASTNGTSISVTYRKGLIARVDDLSAVADAINTIVKILENSN